MSSLDVPLTRMMMIKTLQSAPVIACAVCLDGLAIWLGVWLFICAVSVFRNGDLSNWGTWPGGGRRRAYSGQLDGIDEGGGLSAVGATAEEQGPPGASRRWRQQTEPAQQSSVAGRKSRRSGAEVDGGSWVRLEHKGGSRRSGETSGAAVRAWEIKQ